MTMNLEQVESQQRALAKTLFRDQVKYMWLKSLATALRHGADRETADFSEAHLDEKKLEAARRVARAAYETPIDDTKLRELIVEVIGNDMHDYRITVEWCHGVKKHHQVFRLYFVGAPSRST